MAATLVENVKDMYDVGLKPRMLRTLLKEDVPDVNDAPFDSLSKLSRVVSTIRAHNLLSESSFDNKSINDKLVQRWKSAVDDWVNQLLSLVSNTYMPHKCWAGICLLGLTCQECSSDRFLASYNVWSDKLLLHIQAPVDSQLVKVASCTSISDLIKRLGGFPNAKKDGTAHSVKLIQPLLKLLNEDISEIVWEAAIHLLCAVITFFPASLHRNYDSAEAAITSKILSGKCSVHVLKKLAHCLALLPKSRGDEDNWLLLMQKILLLVNGYLTEIFHGLEEETRWEEAVRLLVPPGEVAPPSLWGQKLLEETSDKERKRSKTSIVSTFMLSCCTMLTTSYPVQVTVPVRSLLALVERVLMVDGNAKSPFVIVTEQELICSELPVLHLHSLELLTSVIKGLRSQLLPHAAYTVRLVKEYLRRCELPELRIKVYSITKLLLITMGVGIAIYIAPEVVNNSLLDLNPISDTSSRNTKASEALLQPCHIKRKHGATVSLEQQHDRIGLEVEPPKKRSTAFISVKIAALEALEALLTVGGALKSGSWRTKIDHLLITIATDSFNGGWAHEERNNLSPNGHSSTCTDLQLAALRALLASLLSPSHVRPPHLAQGLQLFRRGKQEIGTTVSEFCAHALLTLEVLIHPRALPLADFPSAASFEVGNHKFPENIYSGGQKYSIPFSSGINELGHTPSDSDDDLYESWLGGSKETEAPLDSLDKNIDTEKPSKYLRVQSGEKISGALSTGTRSPGRSDQEPAAASADVMVESRQFQETSVQLREPSCSKDGTILAVSSASKDSNMELRLDSNASALGSTDEEMTTVEAVMSDKGEVATRGKNTYTSFSAQEASASAFESDHDSATDSIPDIVDADPDSDSD